METKIKRIVDKYDKRIADIKRRYNNEYASVGITAEGTLELNIWLQEEEEKARKAFINELKEVMTSGEEMKSYV